MRKALVKKLSELAANDKKIILLVGDVGFSFIEDFGLAYPQQFINCGVTEQSMMGVAAGLALSGFKPYVYSMIPFVTMRCYEQLRNDVCYHNANVKVIGVQGSVHYKFLGFSHNIMPDEDVKILQHLPGLGIYLPQTPEEVERDVQFSYEKKGPVYLRI